MSAALSKLLSLPSGAYACSSSSHEFPPQVCRQGRPAAFQPLAMPRWPFAIEIAFKAARDIEGLGEARPRQRHGGGARARAGAAEKQDRRFRVGAGRLQRFGGFGHEIRDWAAMVGKLCHSMQWTRRPSADRSGRPTKFHSAMVRTSTSWALGSLRQHVPGLGGADIAGIVVRRGRGHRCALEKIRGLPGSSPSIKTSQFEEFRGF